MKAILLTQGKFALVDDADFELVSAFKWCAVNHTHTFYAIRGVAVKGKHARNERMHRLILGVTDRTIKVDHIDGDGLNNQRKNLRLCTFAENTRNRKKPSARPSSSRYKGVSWNKKLGTWRAKIKDVYLGLFSDETEAARAYDNAAREYFGQFARPNFLEEK